MNIVFLALGSNVGDSIPTIHKAIKYLSEKVKNIQEAPIYTSKAVGYTDQPDFFNTAIKGETDLEPEELLHFVKNIEQEIGRIHRFRWGPREIDIDIIFYGHEVFKNEYLEIPHPRVHERDFVLIPIADIDENFVHPVMSSTVRELLETLPAQNDAVLRMIEN